MKHIVLLLALILSAGSLTMCRQERAEGLVREFFGERADEYVGYEPVSFGKLGGIYRNPNYVPPVHDEDFEEEEVLKSPPLSPDELKLCGWCMSHAFRTLDGSGTAGLQEYMFYFDKDITQITKWE